MAAPDLEVIKDIPGYKVILKAVIKAQIQQLVEQLAVHTDEESVILTASVADGTLSHLGSDSGKGFLEEQEDVKTQFLGFCLRRHHKKMQAEKEKEKQKAMAPLPGQFDMGPGPRRPRMPYHSGPRHSFSPQGFIRSPGTRHEPYHVRRPGRRTSSETSFTETSQSPLSVPAGPSLSTEESTENVPMKTEPADDNQDSDLANKDEDSSNLSVPSLTNDQSEGRTGDDLDTETVKVEAISESEFELEITGVEPGRPAVPQDNWGPDVSMGMNFDSSQGASGSPADLSAQQGYKPGVIGMKDKRSPASLSELPPFSVDNTICTLSNSESQGYTPSLTYQTSAESPWSGHGSQVPALKFICRFCNKICTSNWKLQTHLRIHTGERPYQCNICDRQFNVKGNLKSHLLKHNK